MLFRCCSIRWSQRSIFGLIHPIECEIFFHNKDQFIPPVTQQTIGNLLWRGLDAPVSSGLLIAAGRVPFYDGMQDS